MTNTPWRGKREELLLINAATDRELDDFTRREEAMQSRATILIGAASLVSAFKIGTNFGELVLVSLALAVLAAACGVVVLFPRTGQAPNPRQMRDAVYAGTSDEEALHNMVRVKLDGLDADERALSRGSWWARIGFILLVLSVALSVVTTGIRIAQPTSTGDPSPTPSVSPSPALPAPTPSTSSATGTP